MTPFSSIVRRTAVSSGAVGAEGSAPGSSRLRLLKPFRKGPFSRWGTPMLGSWVRVVILAGGLAGLAGWILPPVPHIFLIGDSTVADKPLVGSPERGWGQVFPLFLRDEVVVENHARNGRSTKSFLREGRWDSVMARISPGDYVMIQFGHNDAKKADTSRYADARTDYRANLRRFIHDTRSKEAHPILITPVARRRFDASGAFYDVHGEYPAVVRELGGEEHVPVVDLHTRSIELLKRLGPEGSTPLFLHVAPGEFTGLPEGKQDDTHCSWYGAAEVARLVAEELAPLPLGDWLAPQGPPAFPGEGKTVLLDCYYNNEWKRDHAGTRSRFHYTWNDTANSGFSILAGLIVRLGADLDTLSTRPEHAVLETASIYVIVDPDTPRETDHPHFMDVPAADAIETWVRGGGVLVLMANDSGNADLEHLNTLSERFGIRFNSDSRNHVRGTAYETGTFDSLPSVPLFAGVRKIFLKEVCTLTLRDPARALLVDRGEIIMASAPVGEGLVVAVGDPWFYNEYMDERRLPQGYDNRRTAENLFGWLLSLARRIHTPEVASKVLHD
jgi:lysophospholipase L1-like esterase